MRFLGFRVSRTKFIMRCDPFVKLGSSSRQFVFLLPAEATNSKINRVTEPSLFSAKFYCFVPYIAVKFRKRFLAIFDSTLWQVFFEFIRKKNSLIAKIVEISSNKYAVPSCILFNQFCYDLTLIRIMTMAGNPIPLSVTFSLIVGIVTNTLDRLLTFWNGFLCLKA